MPFENAVLSPLTYTWFPGNDEAMQVEESGNMLIMTLSYAQKSGNTDILKKYVSSWSLPNLTSSLTFHITIV